MKNVIITGANSGLGFNTALKVAETSDEYNVIMACRNLDKARSAQKEIINSSGNSNVDLLKLDVSNMQSVKDFVNTFPYDSVDTLVCNAGIGSSAVGLTGDGVDIVFATNHLGHFLLTNLLLDLIDSKIFVVSSDMHDPPSGIDRIGAENIAYPDDSLKDSPLRYFYSKLCNLYFVYELSGRTDVLVNAFNPGMMRTNLMDIKDSAYEFVKNNMPNRLGDLDKSSSAFASLITCDSLSVSGSYFDRSVNTLKTSDLSYNQENREELWSFSEKILNL